MLQSVVEQLVDPEEVSCLILRLCSVAAAAKHVASMQHWS